MLDCANAFTPASSRYSIWSTESPPMRAVSALPPKLESCSV
ncbi:Uncharacterised protein [Vibrio cholerae]|nr:Uncharacterised protein [Vibrio cholerae]